MFTLPAAALAAALAAAAPNVAAAPEATMPAFPTEAGDAAAMLWLKAHTSLGVGRHVVFGPDNVVVVTDDQPGAAASTHKVAFRQEATKIDFVGRSGGRSLKGDGEIDCAAGTFKAGTTELYSGSDLKGALVQRVRPDTQPRRPAAGTATAAMIAAVCAGDDAALTPLTKTAGADAPPPPPPEAAPAAPLESPPPAPPPRRTRGRNAKARPAPPPAAPDPAPAPAPPPAPAPAPPPAELAGPPPAGGPAAQIGAFATEAAARRAFDKLAAEFPDLLAGKALKTEPVKGARAPLVRAVVVGFDSPAAVRDLCARLTASRRACLPRRAP